jgi:hypothetical protein
MKNFAIYFIGCVIGWVAHATFTYLEMDGKPTAMDVYAKKTRMKYRYVDHSVAVDSTVVFKDEYLDK